MSTSHVTIIDPQNRKQSRITPNERLLATGNAAQVALEDGNLYQVQNFKPSLANNASTYLRLFIPDTIAGIGLIIRAACDGNALAVLSSNPTITAPGTPVIPLQRNGLSSNASKVQVFLDGTIANEGLDRSWLMITGGAGGTAEGDSETGTRRILASEAGGSTFLIRLTNQSGLARRALLILTWIELQIGGN